MPDTFLPDQIAQIRPILPASIATPCIRTPRKGSKRSKATKKAKTPARQAGPQPTKLLAEIWGHADDLNNEGHQASVTFGLAWEVMEDISGHAVTAQKRGDNSLLRESDRLYVLLNGIDDRLGAMRKAGDAITKLFSKKPSGSSCPSEDPVVMRYRELREAEAEANKGDVDNGPKIQAYFAAHDRFIAEPATTLAAVLLKLELIYELEDLEGILEQMPQLTWPRIVLGLINSLRTTLGPAE